MSTETDLKAINAQLAATKSELEKTGSSTKSSGSALPIWWSNTDAMTMSVSVLVFGVFCISLAVICIRGGRDADSTLRVIGTILILVSTLFLIVAGYSSDQIAPAMGLLGTVAGYILGRSRPSLAIDSTTASLPK